MWRVRFHDERWLSLTRLLQFQAAGRAMAMHMLACTELPYQRPTAEGMLREHDALPPVLPIVIYNGRSTASGTTGNENMPLVTVD